MKTSKYTHHIFVCTNQRTDGRRSCGTETGMDLVDNFKMELALRKLHVDVRAQKAGCLDVCDHGPAVVVYPEGVFYGHVTVSDVARIVEEHIVNGVPVEALMLRF